MDRRGAAGPAERLHRESAPGPVAASSGGFARCLPRSEPADAARFKFLGTAPTGKAPMAYPYRDYPYFFARVVARLQSGGAAGGVVFVACA